MVGGRTVIGEVDVNWLRGGPDAFFSSLSSLVIA
jgi:hypothetical protein